MKGGDENEKKNKSKYKEWENHENMSPFSDTIYSQCQAVRRFLQFQLYLMKFYYVTSIVKLRSFISVSIRIMLAYVYPCANTFIQKCFIRISLLSVDFVGCSNKNAGVSPVLCIWYSIVAMVSPTVFLLVSSIALSEKGYAYLFTG